MTDGHVFHLVYIGHPAMKIFLFSLTPVVAEWANSIITTGVSNAYTHFARNSTNFQENIGPSITNFSYRGLLNLFGGSLLQSIFITAIFMYMIDRKFIRAILWSLLAAIFALFGLINSTSGVGLLVKPRDDGWKFTVGYTMMAVLFAGLKFAQRKRWVKELEEEPDDLSSEEWAGWNRQRILKNKNKDENSLLLEK